MTCPYGCPSSLGNRRPWQGVGIGRVFIVIPYSIVTIVGSQSKTRLESQVYQPMTGMDRLPSTLKLLVPEEDQHKVSRCLAKLLQNYLGHLDPEDEPTYHLY